MFFNMQNECQVSLNTVENLESFLADINGGRWDQVLPIVAQLKLPRRKVEDLYEQVREDFVQRNHFNTCMRDSRVTSFA